MQTSWNSSGTAPRRRQACHRSARPSTARRPRHDRTVTSVDDLVAATRLHRIGDVVQVSYSRGGTSRTVPVTLQESKG